MRKKNSSYMKPGGGRKMPMSSGGRSSRPGGARSNSGDMGTGPYVMRNAGKTNTDASSGQMRKKSNRTSSQRNMGKGPKS